jgi:alkylation response protein AidB-like acyl-CoA dehydrogenase
MIDLTPTEEQIALRDTARSFATRELAPAVERVYADDGHGLDPWPLLRGVVARGCELGFVSMLVPEAEGGGGSTCLDAAIVFEELGSVDVAAAASYFSLSATLAQLIARAGTPEQKRRWLAPVIAGQPVLFSGALSEPDRAGSDLFSPQADPRVGVQTVARQGADGFVVSGTKSAFVTNAGIADAYLVMARTRFDAPPAQSLTMFYVPADAAGLSVGSRTTLSGWRTSHHAEVVLDDVHVPAENVIGTVGEAGSVFASSPEISICLAACFVGLARAAYDLASRYANERVSWGVPISEHQAVALRLSEMAIDVQAARLLVWDAAIAAVADPMLAATRKAPAAKVFAVDAAIRCTQRAVETLGAYGVTTEYRAARYLNDAWVGWSCDFTRDLLLLGMARA